MDTTPDQVREALVRQWRLIADAIETLDLDVASRAEGWRNRELLAHLALQPGLVRRFLRTATDEPVELSLTDNLSGTGQFASLADEAARKMVAEGKLDFAGQVEATIEPLMAADLTKTVTTLQGPILLSDYLITRCVEAVVHGGDFVPGVVPDEEAVTIVANALHALLRTRHPDLVDEATSLDPLVWTEVATGRRPAPASLAPTMPLLT